MDGHQTVSSVGRKGWNEGTEYSRKRSEGARMGWWGRAPHDFFFFWIGLYCWGGEGSVGWIARVEISWSIIDGHLIVFY